MKLNVRFFSSLCFSLLCTSVSSNLLAAQTEDPERWFEIEVILFKQLDDKKLLKEQFPDNVNSTSLPQYTKYFDTLTSYIQPDLSGIKKFMPLCSEINSQVSFISLPKINIQFSDVVNAIMRVDTFSIHNSTNNLSEDSFFLEQQKEQAFVLHKELATPLFSTQNICVISYKDFEDLLPNERLATFKLDAFDVKSLPNKLNATGLHNPNSPYIISDESLLLTDINQRLQWSKEFKPILHFGWRQIGVTQDKAIPLKLFAGEHLEQQYKKALNNYQSALNENRQAEFLSFAKPDNGSQQITEKSTSIVTNQISQQKNNDAEIKQQKLSQIISEIQSIDNDNITDLIGKLEQQTFEEVISSDKGNKNSNKQLQMSKPPVIPLQEWFLNGYFKVHLDHYLYITADFNVLSESLNTSTAPTDKRLNDGISSANKKLVNFNQNRRVITGEIHYFDHPFIGMIVQIRRFDPAKPKGEAVSQVIK